MDPQAKNRSAKELLADWRAADREGQAARTAAEVAALTVESADAAKAAAAEAESAVRSAAAAVERAKDASDLAKDAAGHASQAAQMIYAAAQKDEDRTAEGVREAETEERRAAGAFHDAQAEGFPKGPADGNQA